MDHLTKFKICGCRNQAYLRLPYVVKCVFKHLVIIIIIIIIIITIIIIIWQQSVCLNSIKT